MKNRGKQKRSKDTIRTILAAATQVLVEHGYEKATTNRIADRAGYSVGTLYQYFDDKEDIYGEVLDQVIARYTLSAANSPVRATLRETLQELLHGVLLGLKLDPALIHSLETLLTGHFQEKHAGFFEALVASMTRLLEAHRAEIAVENLELAARILLAAGQGISNSSNMQLIEFRELEAQSLRLQLAYLTMKI